MPEFSDDDPCSLYDASRSSPPRRACEGAEAGQRWGPLRSNGRVRWCPIQQRLSVLKSETPTSPSPRWCAGPLSPRDDAGGEGVGRTKLIGSAKPFSGTLSSRDDEQGHDRIADDRYCFTCNLLVNLLPNAAIQGRTHAPVF